MSSEYSNPEGRNDWRGRRGGVRPTTATDLSAARRGWAEEVAIRKRLGITNTQWRALPLHVRRQERIKQRQIGALVGTRADFIITDEAGWPEKCEVIRPDPRIVKRLERRNRVRGLLDNLNNQHTGIKDGEVYIASNPAWPGWLKIGSAIDAEDRINSFNTYSPFRDYVLEDFFDTDDRKRLEDDVHMELAYCRGGGEWFRTTLEVARHTIARCRARMQQQS